MDLHVDVIKGGMHTYNVHENAIFMPGNTDVCQFTLTK